MPMSLLLLTWCVAVTADRLNGPPGPLWVLNRVHLLDEDGPRDRFKTGRLAPQDGTVSSGGLARATTISSAEDDDGQLFDQDGDNDNDDVGDDGYTELLNILRVEIGG